MRARLLRAAVLALLTPLALGGAFGHIDGIGALSHGTQLFHPDHPNHAPFVPQHEHACAACAVGNLLPPASAPIFLIPPSSRHSFDASADCENPGPFLHAPSGRSPPSVA